MLIILKRFKWILIGVLLIFSLGSFWYFKSATFHPTYEIGQEIDSFNNVPVYFNGGVSNLSGRNLSSDGYNYGLKYQCVEFVKRYYYDHLNHEMPNTWGNAKNFFKSNVADGQINSERKLLQYTNPSSTKPKVNDLSIFDATKFNKFGHVAIVSRVDNDKIEIIQQNAGINAPSRETFPMTSKDEKWLIKDTDILGWLRKE